jgi:hypothetical protein
VSLLQDRAEHRHPGLVLDARGAIYLEFLIAFGPMFLLFLGICQLALIATAELVVRHSANAAVRSAIVVLEESPRDYLDAPRGSLSAGSPVAGHGAEAVLSALGLALTPEGEANKHDTKGSGSEAPRQQGARMVPIRTAAYFPLLVLAPKANATAGASSLSGSLPSNFTDELRFALAFTRSATVVTVHTRAGAEELAREPVERDANVTVRVTYLYPCGVPMVRTLICHTLASLLKPSGARVGTGAELPSRMRLAETPAGLEHLVSPDARFAVLSAEGTLPNQGAAYYGDDP